MIHPTLANSKSHKYVTQGPIEEGGSIRRALRSMIKKRCSPTFCISIVCVSIIQVRHDNLRNATILVDRITHLIKMKIPEK